MGEGGRTKVHLRKRERLWERARQAGNQKCCLYPLLSLSTPLSISPTLRKPQTCSPSTVSTCSGLTTEVALSQGQALLTGQSPHDGLWPVTPTELLSPLTRGEVPQTKGPECSGASALPSPAREPAAELLFFVHRG